MSDKIINLNDAILDINSECQFENQEPYTDYSKIVWQDGSPTVSKADAEAKIAELQTIEDAKPTLEELKTSAKAKLIAGESLTQDEANTIVL